MELQYFDLLGNEPIKIDGFCSFIPPTIKSIRKLGYDTYNLYRWALSLDKIKYLKHVNLFDEYNSLSYEEQDKQSLYSLISVNVAFINLYIKIFDFFIAEDVLYDTENCRFVICIDNNLVGFIDENNFIDVVNCILQLNHIKIKKEKQLKFKNESARRAYEKIQKGREENKFSGIQIDFPHIISKFCIANNNGINILNVNELTVFQLYDQFEEYRFQKETEIQDYIYTNTVSYSDLNKYDSSAWLKNNETIDDTTV